MASRGTGLVVGSRTVRAVEVRKKGAVVQLTRVASMSFIQIETDDAAELIVRFDRYAIVAMWMRFRTCRFVTCFDALGAAGIARASRFCAETGRAGRGLAAEVSLAGNADLGF